MAEAPSTARVRAHRERRRLGTHSVQVQVDKDSIAALVRLGYLPEALRQDGRAIQEAVETYISDAPLGPLVGVTAVRRAAQLRWRAVPSEIAETRANSSKSVGNPLMAISIWSEGVSVASGIASNRYRPRG